MFYSLAVECVKLTTQRVSVNTVTTSSESGVDNVGQVEGVRKTGYLVIHSQHQHREQWTHHEHAVRDFLYILRHFSSGLKDHGSTSSKSLHRYSVLSICYTTGRQVVQVNTYPKTYRRFQYKEKVASSHTFLPFGFLQVQINLKEMVGK